MIYLYATIHTTICLIYNYFYIHPYIYAHIYTPICIVSAGMSLPFSSFPNVNSLLVKNDFKKSYLTTADYIKTGLPLTCISICLIITIVNGFIHMFVV